MSRIGKKPVQIPNGVTVEIKGNEIKVKGSKGELKLQLHDALIAEMEDKNIVIKKKPGMEEHGKSIYGTTRTLVDNMMNGVTKGFEKKLEIQGVGYRATVGGKKLTLALGFSHPIEFTIPEGITITIDQEKKNILTVAGISKQLVGQVSANIRELKKPEPYKGKGIRYVGEYVQRKAGKAAAGAKGGA
ncbi:MAG: 50S ribosomal protein L6 [Patescibacteria group bacterium]